MNVNCYKHTQNTHRNKSQTFIKRKMGVQPWNRQRQTPLGFKPDLRALNLTLIQYVPYKTNSVYSNPRPINLQHQQKQTSM